MKTVAMALAMTAFVMPVAAEATTYVASRTVGATGTLNFSVTTDDTIGALTNANVTDWTITIGDGIGSITLTPGNSAFLTSTGLSATAANLLFDFSSSGFALWQNPSTGSGQNFYCLAGTTCGFYSGAENLLVGSDFPGGIQTTARTGVQIVASAGGVPEPASWALMIAGIGIAGGALRTARRRTMSVRFA